MTVRIRTGTSSLSLLPTSPSLADMAKPWTALFLNSPHESISYIWQVTGCQHSLLPADDDFAAPSIPALTL